MYVDTGLAGKYCRFNLLWMPAVCFLGICELCLVRKKVQIWHAYILQCYFAAKRQNSSCQSCRMPRRQLLYCPTETRQPSVAHPRGYNKTVIMHKMLAGWTKLRLKVRRQLPVPQSLAFPSRRHLRYVSAYYNKQFNELSQGSSHWLCGLGTSPVCTSSLLRLTSFQFPITYINLFLPPFSF